MAAQKKKLRTNTFCYGFGFMAKKRIRFFWKFLKRINWFSKLARAQHCKETLNFFAFYSKCVQNTTKNVSPAKTKLLPFFVGSVFLSLKEINAVFVSWTGLAFVHLPASINYVINYYKQQY